MKRDVIRAYRHRGIRPLTIPVMAIALVLFGFYQYADEYAGHREEVTELAARLDVIEGTLSFSKNIEAHNAMLKSEYSSIQSRAFRADTFDESLGSMKTTVNDLLASLYFEKIEITTVPSSPIRLAKQLAVDVRFSGVPQQLPRLEAALASHPKAMRVSDLQIKVADDSADGAPHIEVSARMLGVYLTPDVVAVTQPTTPAR